MSPHSVTGKKFLSYSVASVFITFLFVSLTYSWGSAGHKIINLKAVMHLPDSMASLKADSMFYYYHASDPDYRKDYSDTSFFCEHYRHYIDIDVYPNYHSLPHSLDSMFMLYSRNYVWSNGTLPWAIVLTLDSLTAQFRRGATAKAESTMSDLGHYVADAYQPLHCTENYDGDMTGNDGIHSRYESTLINNYQTSISITQDAVQYISSPLDFAFEYIYESNDLVDSIMEADTYAKDVSGWTGGSFSSVYYQALWEKTQYFTKERFQHATVALASLWYTAWVNAHATNSITASAYGNGSIVPSGIVTILQGSDTTFRFTPQTGYHVDSVHADGNKVDSLASYTFRSISTNHTLEVWFGINMYTITATYGLHGTIVPSGVLTLPYDSSVTFQFTPDSGYTVDSVLVNEVPVDTASSYTFLHINQNHTLRVVFREQETIFLNTVFEKWNMLSLPLTVTDDSVRVLYPTASSFAFEYDGAYVAVNRLRHGKGCWLKFNAGQVIPLSGYALTQDTINLEPGWNMIGSIALPIPVQSIVSIPEGMETSLFFGYTQTGYNPVDTVMPGKGYWVKVDQSCKLILSSSAAELSSAQSIKRNRSAELPPPPPSTMSEVSEVPSAFILEQNYPNPFNPSTVIRYQLSDNSLVTLKVYDMLGKEVTTLVNGIQEAGYKSVTFDASGLPSGVYYYRLTTGEQSEIRKMTVMK